MFSGVKAINQSLLLHGLGKVVKSHTKIQTSQVYDVLHIAGFQAVFLKAYPPLYKSGSALRHTVKLCQQLESLSEMVLVVGLSVLGRWVQKHMHICAKSPLDFKAGVSEAGPLLALQRS